MANTERPTVKPYVGLDRLQELLQRIQLELRSKGFDVKRIEAGEGFRAEHHEIRELGLALTFDAWDKEAIASAVDASGLAPEDIEIVVISDAQFLRNRCVHIRTPITGIKAALPIAAQDGKRHESLEDRRHGFDIVCQLVLTRNQRNVVPLRPNQAGTILAEVEFSVTPVPNGIGLNPKPLTDEVRDKFGLSNKTELFVNAESGLLEAKDIQDNIQVYLHKDIYRLVSTQRDKIVAKYLLAAGLNALEQVVYLVAAELKDASESDIAEYAEDLPPIVSLIHFHVNALKQADLRDEKSLLAALRDRPTKVAAVLSGARSNVVSWLSVLSPEVEENDAE
jgi:hypothetical protein